MNFHTRCIFYAAELHSSVPGLHSRTPMRTPEGHVPDPSSIQGTLFAPLHVADHITVVHLAHRQPGPDDEAQTQHKTNRGDHRSCIHMCLGQLLSLQKDRVLGAVASTVARLLVLWLGIFSTATPWFSRLECVQLGADSLHVLAELPFGPLVRFSRLTSITNLTNLSPNSGLRTRTSESPPQCLVIWLSGKSPDDRVNFGSLLQSIN